MATKTIKTVVFMGSARDIAPPWGGDSRAGTRMLKHVQSVLASRETKIGEENVKHEVTVFDPLEVFCQGGALEGDGELKSPHFFFGQGQAPPKMDAMRDVIKAADCYVIVTAEYNHSIPPALSSMMGHFGGSNYATKPSGIVTYSPSPWGGCRAAMALRPFLSELGCLPVSKLAHFPDVGGMFEADGTPKDPEHRMLKQLPNMLNELEWMAIAMMNMKEKAGPPPS
eukprot:CAMPEP_0181293760 /NCGR_PEP_ID=MMETSP1101-20121128/3234_1 /TAXON_ID=46948 /ORGANISM="Rhodomonas abbreviata, Strain Caron Lab Isolate" /LENGTH=225 /DNA_ID=CAMNT_0023398363 /DNA_START=106 /DNA_END=783 /DNA_ORIENTATION=+